MRKQVEETALVMFFMVSFLSNIMPNLRAWSVGVGEGNSSGGHHELVKQDVLFPKISTYVFVTVKFDSIATSSWQCSSCACGSWPLRWRGLLIVRG